MGDTVRVNTIGPVTISTYVANTINLTPEQIQGAGQPMTIDQANYFYFALDDVNKAQINVNVMEQAIRRASFGMRDVIDEYQAALMAAGVHEDNVLETSGTTSSSATNPIIVGEGNVNCYELLVDISTRLNKANVPGSDRWVVVNPDFSRMPGLAILLPLVLLKLLSPVPVQGQKMVILPPCLKPSPGSPCM
jgi:hypothetical protein